MLTHLYLTGTNIEDEDVSRNSDHSLTEGDSASEAGKAEFLNQNFGEQASSAITEFVTPSDQKSWKEDKAKDRARSIAVLWVHKSENLRAANTNGSRLTPSQNLLKRLSFAKCEAELYARLYDSTDLGELFSLLRYILFGNVLCLGKPWGLKHTEALLGCALNYQITRTLILQQVGEHIEVSEWFATEAIRRSRLTSQGKDRKATPEQKIIQACGGGLDPVVMGELVYLCWQAMSEEETGVSV